MKEKEWEAYRPLFQTAGSYTGYRTRNIEGAAAPSDYVTYQYYIVYLILQMLVVKGQIPYRGIIPPWRFMKQAETWCDFHADEEIMQLLAGIMKGCGLEVSACEILKYPVYENGHSGFRYLDLEMELGLYALIQRVPDTASVRWFDEIQDIVGECLRYGYYGYAGAVVIIWSNDRYHKVSRHETWEQQNRLRTIYDKSRFLLQGAILLPEDRKKEVSYIGLVAPLHKKLPSGEICYLQLLDILNPMALYYLVALDKELSRMERRCGLEWKISE